MIRSKLTAMTSEVYVMFSITNFLADQLAKVAQPNKDDQYTLKLEAIDEDDGYNGRNEQPV